MMASSPTDRNKANVLWFDELSMRDVGLVGGKNASLGEMYRQLTPKGVKIPNGFAVTATAFHRFLREAEIADEIKRVLTGLDTRDLHELETRGALVRGLILGKEMPGDIVDDIRKAYVRLEHECVFARTKQLELAPRMPAGNSLPDRRPRGTNKSIPIHTCRLLCLHAWMCACADHPPACVSVLLMTRRACLVSLRTPPPPPAPRPCQWNCRYSGHVDVAVRSSATAEDLPNASFAGQQDTCVTLIMTKNRTLFFFVIENISRE